MTRAKRIELQLSHSADRGDSLVHVHSDPLGQRPKPTPAMIDGIAANEQPFRRQLSSDRAGRVTAHVNNRGST